MSQHQSRVAARERLVDAPLRTSAIREREEKKREAKYPTVSPTPMSLPNVAYAACGSGERF